MISPLVVGLAVYAVATYVREGRWPAMDGKAASRMAAAGVVFWVVLLGVWIARFFGAFGGPVPV